MADFIIRQGTRLPSLTATLTDANNAVVDLSSGVTGVTFRMRKEKHGVFVIDDEDAVIVDAEAGEVRYDWAAGDTDNAGHYWAYFIVNYTSGLTLSFPAYRYIEVYIESR